MGTGLLAGCQVLPRQDSGTTSQITCQIRTMLAKIARLVFPTSSLTGVDVESLRRVFLGQIQPTIYLIFILTVAIGLVASVQPVFLAPIALQALLVAGGFALGERRKWSSEAGAWWYLGNFWAYVTYAVLVTGGVRGPFFPSYVVIILTAGVLLDPRSLPAVDLGLAGPAPPAGDKPGLSPTPRALPTRPSRGPLRVFDPPSRVTG